MKRVFSLIFVFVLLFMLVSCGGGKKKDPANEPTDDPTDEKPAYEEQVTQEVSASEGGTIKNSDESVSIEIPADALGADTEITMKIYDAKGYVGTEGEEVISKVVEFEPSGTVFSKPVIITMQAVKDVDGKILSAAVYRESKGEWSYNEHGVYAVLMGRDAAGDPIMQSAAGDPIMLSAAGDPIMQSAAGDPIMMAAAGDPIMLASAGDPIMTNAAGDPIMTSAAGDPIMMTTGHFTAYTFIALEPKEPGEHENDGEITDEDGDEITDEEILDDETDDDMPDEEIPDEIEDADETEDADADGVVIPEPEKVYSKVLCTGMAICTDGEGNQILCPDESEEFYGQDAQYAAGKGCVPHSYTKIPDPSEESDFQNPPFIKDNVTGLTWWLTGRGGSFEEMREECSVSYGGIEDWRLPAPQEVATLSDLGILYGSRVDPVYFGELYYNSQDVAPRSYQSDLVLTSMENYFYILPYGVVTNMGGSPQLDSDMEGYLLCVSGDEYGKVSAGTYSTVTENGEEMIRDLSTDLFWQKEPVKKATWKEALSYCESLEYAGHTDWRLPNKNELLSLVDYSKTAAEAEEEEGGEAEAEEEEAVALSSFPGMAADVFWTSTPAPVDYDVWVLSMQAGTLAPNIAYSGQAPVKPQQPQLLKSIKRDEITEDDALSVLCVRSDLDETEEIPACSETGTGACKDSNGTIWSSRLYPEIFVDFEKSFMDSGDETVAHLPFIIEMCRYLNENGSNKWRLPTIDEIRSIVTSEKLRNGGTCGVTSECSSESCYSEEMCTGDEPSKTTLNDFGIMLSGTLDDESHLVWFVDAATGELGFTNSTLPVSGLVQRCVLDPYLDYEETPYPDPETGLTWSDISSEHFMTTSALSDAELYCESLGEDSGEHWRLPTTAELQTLVRNCGEAPCATDFNGKYSLLGDMVPLWAKDGEDVYFLDFSIAETYAGEAGNYYMAKVRCVRSDEE